MTSEIRVNKLTNRIGLSTVTFADSGIGVTVTGRIDPDTDSARDLGTTSVRWRNGYFDTLYGDGSNLTGITQTTINNNATTKFITGTNNANELDCEANLSYNNSLVTFSSSSLMVDKGTNATISVKETAGNKEAQFRANTDGGLLRTVGNYPLILGTNQLERLRIHSDGKIDVGGNESAYKFNIIDESNRTTTAETALLLYAKHDGSGTTGAGFGTGIRFWGDRASGNVEQNMGRIMCTAEVNSGTTLSGALSFDTSVNGSLAERLRITSDGQVLIGATSYAGGGNNPALYISTTSANGVKFHKTGGGQSSLQLTTSSGTGGGQGNNSGFQLTQEGTSSYIQNQDDGNMYVLMGGTRTILHRPNGTISSRSSAGGSNTATYNENVAWNSFSCNSSNGYDFKIINQNSSPAYTYSLELAAAANVNNTNYRHINCTKNSNSAGIFVVYGNGNVQNANNSYGQTSDVKLKENIVDANSQWDDIKGLRVRNFNFKSDSGYSTHRQIGLIAQEAETVSAGLIENVPDVAEDENGIKTETGTVTKELKYSVLYMKAIKALQEAITRIEKLESDNVALRARVTNLEGN